MAQLNTRIILRNDSTVNWNAASDEVLLKGEIGLEFLDSGKVKMKVGDGVSTWAALPYFGGDDARVFETTAAANQSHTEALAAVVGDTELNTHDVGIVKVLISGDKYQHTAYRWNGSAWAAMDGNYNAENVYFDEDLIATEAVGTISIPSSGSATIAAAGKNIKEVLASILAAEANPETTDPSVSFNSVSSGAKEVGTTLTPSYNAKLNAGSYTYGPETGIVASSWEISDTAGNTKDTASGSMPELTVLDDTNYKITAKANYEAGAVPVTNIGNEYSDGQIPAGSKSATSSAITGYRAFFYGVLATSTVDAPLTSAIIRGLTNGGAYNASKTFTLNGNDVEGAKRIVIAIPSNSTRSGLKEVILTSAMNTPVTDSYVLTENAVSVADSRGNDTEGNPINPTNYDVYVYEPAAIDAGEVHKITLA